MITIEHSRLQTTNADIAILVATDSELETGISFLVPVSGYSDILKVMWNEGVYYLGIIGLYKCVLTMCRMGSRGRDGSIQFATRMIERWSPRALLLVGIAFGKDRTKQILGDIIVSTHIHDYEPARIGSMRDEQRGPSPEAGITLLNRARNLGFTWIPPETGSPRKALYGPILSGEKLIDNEDFKQELFSHYPDAIAGEMEAVGMYSSASVANIEWLVVKSICDWADGKKTDDFQLLAARNSFEFTRSLLSEPGLDTTLSRPRTSITAERQPHPLSVQQTLLEAAIKEIRITYQRREDAGKAINSFAYSFMQDGQLQVPSTAMPLYHSLDAAHIQAREAWLNSYEDVCARFLQGTVLSEAFVDALGQEIIELCEDKGLDDKGLKPRETTSYPNIWRAYDKIMRFR